MAKITVQSNPRVYNFQINDLSFVCQIQWKDTFGIRPIDILISELEECVDQLKKMPNIETKDQFKLPPINPNDSSQNN